MRLRRRPFVELIDRQLALFEQDYAGLIRDCELALRAYNTAPRAEAEERYGDYLDLVDTGRERLEEIRDAYADTLDADAAKAYDRAFNDLARRRLPRFGLELE
jgi:hypothetical protein